MNSYISVSIKIETARKFKEFAKTHECSYSELLDHMIQFFIGHQLSPLADFDEALSAREEKLLKRINNVISIIRNIEKTQTQPTLAILEALMVQGQPKHAELLYKLPDKAVSETPDQEDSSEGNNTNLPKKTMPRSINNKGSFEGSNEVQNTNRPTPAKVQKDHNLIPKEELENLLLYLVSRVKAKKPVFGKNELILDITREEFRRIEIKIKSLPDVHKH